VTLLGRNGRRLILTVGLLIAVWVVFVVISSLAGSTTHVH
jgi:hypothetical protein